MIGVPLPEVRYVVISPIVYGVDYVAQVLGMAWGKLCKFSALNLGVSYTVINYCLV